MFLDSCVISFFLVFLVFFSLSLSPFLWCVVGWDLTVQSSLLGEQTS